MPQLTLLKVVQSYLSATDGWNVNTISENQESEQVALIAEEVYYEVVNDIRGWKFTQELLQLDSVADNTKPNYLTIPNSWVRIQESQVRYDKRSGESTDSALQYTEVKYLPPYEFLDLLNQRSTLTDETEIVTDFSGVQFVILNKKHPEYCTSFDDQYLVFDSYNSDVETTLQSSKSQLLATKERTFQQTDDYLIDLPVDLQPAYLNLVKARASEYLRQEPLFTDARLGRNGLIKYRTRQHKIGNPGRRPYLKRYGRN